MSANINFNQIETLVKDMVFGAENQAKQRQIREKAADAGIYPASIQELYEKIGQGQFSGFTVPAMNLRGITFDMARAAFRAALKNKVGPYIFEIARSEMLYTWQTPARICGRSIGRRPG